MRRLLSIALALLCATSNANDRMDLFPPWNTPLVLSFNTGGVGDRGWGANSGTLQNGATVSTVLALDGTNDYLSFPDADQLDMPSAFSVSMWVEPSTPGVVDRHLAGKYATGAGSHRSYQLWASYGGGYWQAIVTRDGTLTAPYLNYRWAASMPASGWNHVAWVVDTDAAGTGTRMKLYVNGTALTASLIFSDSSGFTPQNNTIALIFGAFEGATGAWKGNMDSIVVFRSAITADQVGAIYSSGRR